MDLHYFLHGLLILMVGLLAGFPFAKAIRLQNGKEVAWRVVHSGSSVAGIMLIAIGGVIGRLELCRILDILIFLGVAVSTYLFVFGMLLAAIYSERGIGRSKSTPSRLWKTVKMSYAVGALLSILSVGLLIIVCVLKILA